MSYKGLWVMCALSAAGAAMAFGVAQHINSNYTFEKKVEPVVKTAAPASAFDDCIYGEVMVRQKDWPRPSTLYVLRCPNSSTTTTVQDGKTNTSVTVEAK